MCTLWPDPQYKGMRRSQSHEGGSHNPTSHRAGTQLEVTVCAIGSYQTPDFPQSWAFAFQNGEDYISVLSKSAYGILLPWPNASERYTS